MAIGGAANSYLNRFTQLGASHAACTVGAPVLGSPAAAWINTSFGRTINPAVPTLFQPAPSNSGNKVVNWTNNVIFNSPSVYDTPDRDKPKSPVSGGGQ